MFNNGRGAMALALAPTGEDQRVAGSSSRHGWRLVVPVALAAAIGLAFFVSGGSAAMAGQTARAEGIKVANSCAAGCRKRHNQCRIRTKGSSSCDAQLNACLQKCLRR